MIQIKMKLVFIGKPGSGKGTQAKIISKELNLAHISTGDLVRNVKGELEELIHSYIDKGNFVPDDLMIRMLKERIQEEDCKNGFILDGFPRTLVQARELEKEIKIDNFVNIYISDEEAVNRMSGRKTCRECGELYNFNTKYVPKNEKECDKCGGELYEREDQKEEIIGKRIQVHHAEVEPIINKYKPMKVDGTKSIEEVTEDILDILKT